VSLALQEGWKEGQYWDTAEAYHYVRAVKHDQEGLVLIVGGEDHNTGIKPDEYEVRADRSSVLLSRVFHWVISTGTKPSEIRV